MTEVYAIKHKDHDGFLKFNGRYTAKVVDHPVNATIYTHKSHAEYRLGASESARLVGHGHIRRSDLRLVRVKFEYSFAEEAV